MDDPHAWRRNRCGNCCVKPNPFGRNACDHLPVEAFSVYGKNVDGRLARRREKDGYRPASNNLGERGGYMVTVRKRLLQEDDDTRRRLSVVLVDTCT